MCVVSIGIGLIFLSLNVESFRIINIGSVCKADETRSTSRANQILFSRSGSGVKLSTSSGQCKFPTVTPVVDDENGRKLIKAMLAAQQG